MSFFSGHDDAIDYSVERRAITALNPKKVPSARIIRLFTVVAGNIYHPSQLRRHLLQCHARRHRIPSWHHALFSFRGFLTNRASGVMGRKLSEALPVNGVAARHLMRGTPRTKEKLLANWAVGFVFSTLAVVIGIQAFVDAHATIVTMLEILCTTNTAKPAIRTVIWLFVVCHPQVTYVAMVVTKQNPAVHTVVSKESRSEKN
jgi:hypothetical protein